MKQLAQALLDEYPNQEVVIFFNPSVDDAYYKNAIFKPIKRKLIKDRLDTIVNEPLQSPNNVTLMSIPDLKTMIQ